MNLCCMKCTSVLDKARIDDVEVDLCPRCSGLWLDHGEIERLSRKLASEIDRRLLADRKGPPPVPHEIQSVCPSCTSSMKESILGDLHVDFCTRCKGIFLDRGELDRALALVQDSRATFASLLAAAGSTAE